MKRLILLSLLITLVLWFSPACGSSEEETIPSPTPFGQLSAEEGEAILHDYLAAQIRTVTDSLQRYVLSNYLARTRSHWIVHSREMGRPYLEITGMGFDGLELNDSGLWRAYDVTGAVEPQNNHSQGLLVLMLSK